MKKNKIKKNRWKKIAIIFTIVSILLFAWAGLTKAGYMPNFFNIGILCSGEEDNSDIPSVFGNSEPEMVKKPVIYLYPEHEQDIQVKLIYKGEIIADFPRYDELIEGWEVTAYPDGKIINHSDNKEYSYLFWEGIPEEKVDWDLSEGFVVKGEDTREFLQEKLQEMGLTPKEYNEFIVYWYPLMKNNKYNLIHFADEQYTETAQLTISPKPDSILRVFMVYKPLNEKIEIEEQEIKSFERKGFTVVEWGGTKAE